MTEYHSIHAERLREERERFGLGGAVLFNSFNVRDQQAVLDVYKIKLEQGELGDFFGDKVVAVENVAKTYLAQKCAFQDVLVKDGFEIVSEVEKDYDGRIATLSNYGTLTILGKPSINGRFITMSRIHSPRLNYNHSRGDLDDDLKLGYPAFYLIRKNGSRGRHTNSSVLRGIAINPRGTGEGELEANQFQTIIDKVAFETVQSMHRPFEELVRISLNV